MHGFSYLKPLNALDSASWIWKKGESTPDEYATFVFDVETEKGECSFAISSDSDYALYVDDKLIAFSQYPCFEHSPVGDLISFFLEKGSHQFRIEAYYLGSSNFSSYSKGKAGIIFSLWQNGKEILHSNEKILSCLNAHYAHGKQLIITPQLGYRFFYDATAKDLPFSESQIVDKPKDIALRPNRKCTLAPRSDIRLIKKEGSRYLFDLGKETVGLLDLDFSSPKQKIEIRYAEHLVDGDLVYQIGNRDFSFEYLAKEGNNKFLHPFRRLGLRYLEIIAEKEIEIAYIGIRSVDYPFVEIPYSIKDPLRQKIYDTCIQTLRCCYHEHYEDCPWREQCLYALDARNQMLAGYHCFENKEAAKASLALFLQDRREDDVLSICAPCDLALFIPSFSLHFFTAMDEFYQYSNDLEFIKDSYPRLVKLINAFIRREKNGMLKDLKEPGAWNFYEWANHLDGYHLGEEPRYDLILNALYSLALVHMGHLASAIGEKDIYSPKAGLISKKIRELFFDKEKGVYYMAEDDRSTSILGNALAILASAPNEEEAKILAEKLIKPESDMTPITLSMKTFLYDALLKVSPSYQDWILADIDATYKKMLDDGATTFYETEEGYPAFDNAGSLCHGWSAMPIYYYHLFHVGERR